MTNEAATTAAGPLLLVLDYTGRRAEAPVSCLELENQGFDVRNLLDPPYGRETTAQAYAARLLDRADVGDRPVTAVLAYCMAGPLAQEVAAVLSARSGDAVPLVLFDGEPATPAAIQSEYLLAGRRLGQLLGLGGADAVPDGVVEEPALREAPERVLAMIRSGLTGLGERAADLGTADPDDAQDDAEAAAEFYLDWLAHLVAAHNTAWPAWPGRVTAIASDDHRWFDAWPGAADTTYLRVPAGRNELLRHPETRTLVLSILENRGIDG